MAGVARPRMKSVRWTALAGIGAILVPVAIIASLIAYLVGREEANFVFDGVLAQIALHLDPDMHVQQQIAQLHDPEDTVAVTVWDANGSVVADNSGGAIPRSTATGFVDVVIRGEKWRMFVTHAHGRTMQVAQRQEVRDEVAEHLALSAALPMLASLPLVWALVALGLSRLFRTLDSTSASVSQRNVHSTEPLSTTAMPREIHAFIEAMNELLRRQALALEQQRRFVSDAAHELRTPLTSLQLLVDTLAVRTARNDFTAHDVIPELTAALKRSRALMAQLLQLAEADAGRETSTSAVVDLRQIAMDVVATLLPLATQRNIEFSVLAGSNIRITAAAVDVHTLFSVLVDNAVRHGPAGGIVEIGLRLLDDAVLFEVRDDGAGVPEDALSRIFDRFFRAASQSIEGAGLGLAIARAIADRYGFAIAVGNHPEGGCVATVRIALG